MSTKRFFVLLSVLLTAALLLSGTQPTAAGVKQPPAEILQHQLPHQKLDGPYQTTEGLWGNAGRWPTDGRG